MDTRLNWEVYHQFDTVWRRHYSPNIQFVREAVYDAACGAYPLEQRGYYIGYTETVADDDLTGMGTTLEGPSISDFLHNLVLRGTPADYGSGLFGGKKVAPFDQTCADDPLPATVLLCTSWDDFRMDTESARAGWFGSQIMGHQHGVNGVEMTTYTKINQLLPNRATYSSGYIGDEFGGNPGPPRDIPGIHTRDWNLNHWPDSGLGLYWNRRPGRVDPPITDTTETEATLFYPDLLTREIPKPNSTTAGTLLKNMCTMSRELFRRLNGDQWHGNAVGSSFGYLSYLELLATDGILKLVGIILELREIDRLFRAGSDFECGGTTYNRNTMSIIDGEVCATALGDVIKEAERPFAGRTTQSGNPYWYFMRSGGRQFMSGIANFRTLADENAGIFSQAPDPSQVYRLSLARLTTLPPAWRADNWDLRSNEQLPALKFGGGEEVCGELCGEIIPNQPE